MIEEAYVSFETAKLLKENGMDKECFTHYIQKNNSDGTSEAVTTCTQQMAMRWLREVHNIDIVVFHEKLPNDCYWARIERHPFTEYQQKPIYKSYEEAVDAAIQYSLKNLI